MPDTGRFYVTDEVRADYNKHGFILVRKLFDEAEVAKLKAYMEQSKSIEKHAYGRSDGMSRVSRMCVWNKAGDDIAGVVARYSK